MNINADKTGTTTVTLTLSGRLDAANAPLLERKIKQWGEEITEFIFDFSQLEYISSMGLRILLQTQKALKEKDGRLVIRNMREAVREVFEMTGFLKLMVLEEKFVAVRKDEPGSVTLFFNGEMENENVADVAKALREIREQKSHKTITKETIRSEEMSEIVGEGANASGPVTLILDMEKLEYISPGALKNLKEAVAETAWDKRTLEIRNAAPEVQASLENEEFGELLEVEE